MHSTTNKQYEEYRQYLYDKDYSRIITLDLVRFWVQAYKYDTEAIGKQILEYYGKYQVDGYYEIIK